MLPSELSHRLNELSHPLRILRLPEVKARTGKTQSAIYRGMGDGSFPKSIPIGPHTRGWLESEIHDWIAARVAERDGKAAA
jgi:prophage regulatory protein